MRSNAIHEAHIVLRHCACWDILVNLYTLSQFTKFLKTYTRLLGDGFQIYFGLLRQAIPDVCSVYRPCYKLHVTYNSYLNITFNISKCTQKYKSWFVVMKTFIAFTDSSMNLIPNSSLIKKSICHWADINYIVWPSTKTREFNSQTRYNNQLIHYRKTKAEIQQIHYTLHVFCIACSNWNESR